MKPILCPRCKKPTVYAESNKFRPFCSERCLMIDLGNWADETYSVPDESQDQSSQENVNAELETEDES